MQGMDRKHHGMHGATLKQLTSKVISTLLFKDPLQTFKKNSEYFYILC
jgi:hypothetical protein